ncbi:MAG: N-acetyl sugar amidotransferase [Bacteroidota bacterium]
MERAYQICTKTVMDTEGDPDIKFDKDGVCNYYYEFLKNLKIRVPPKDEANKKLKSIIEKIKKSGQGKQYDIVIGVSGGVDSTYTAWLVKQYGLRPLAVHLDNGWDSELAVKNIENILNKLGIDLFTEVLDWEMFKDLQLSFLKASTPDGEIPSDHAIWATLYNVANKFGIKYIISGMNFRNEGFLPPSWVRGALDYKYIKSVHKIFGHTSLENYPHLSKTKFIYYNLFKGIKVLSFINYIDFNKNDAMKKIQEELDWKYYGGKHYESNYTKFYQGYILPKKFKIDKRKAHYTCLMLSTGEITRSEALEQLKQPALNPTQIEQDKEYIIKKLGITNDQFNEIMNAPIKSIFDYPNTFKLELKFRAALLYLRKLKILPN